jgi:DNA-binding NarL/FixJ family response regulator
LTLFPHPHPLLSSYPQPIRVVVADDHVMVRIGLRCLLDRTPDIRVVGEAATTGEVMEQMHRLTPDVLILDWEMPGLAGEELLASLTGGYPMERIMVLAPAINPERGQAALALGVGALIMLPQTFDEATLTGTVRRLARKARRGG